MRLTGPFTTLRRAMERTGRVERRRCGCTLGDDEDLERDSGPAYRVHAYVIVLSIFTLF